MEPEELLSLMTLGAIAPYALEAVLRGARTFVRSAIGAYAPEWRHLQDKGTHSA